MFWTFQSSDRKMFKVILERRGFESQLRILEGHFSHYVDVKTVMFT